MRLSVSTSLLNRLPGGGYYPVEQCLDLLHAAGFDWLDACLWEYSKPGRPLDRDDWREWVFELREYADRIGVSFYQTHGNTLSGMQWDDPAYEREAERVWKNNYRCVEATALLGAKWMVMHPANLPHDPVYSAKKAKDHNLRYLAPYIEAAKNAGIGIAIENMAESSGRRRYCGCDPEELLDLVDTINDGSVGICIDTGHANISGLNAAEFIRMAGKRLKCTHIDDNNGDRDSHLPPYFGKIDWSGVMAALHEIGYENDFSFELTARPFPVDHVLPWCRFVYEIGSGLIGAQLADKGVGTNTP